MDDKQAKPADVLGTHLCCEIDMHRDISILIEEGIDNIRTPKPMYLFFQEISILTVYAHGWSVH